LEEAELAVVPETAPWVWATYVDPLLEVLTKRLTLVLPVLAPVVRLPTACVWVGTDPEKAVEGKFIFNSVADTVQLPAVSGAPSFVTLDLIIGTTLFQVVESVHPLGAAVLTNNIIVPEGISEDVESRLLEIAVAIAPNSVSTSLPLITFDALPVARLSFAEKSVVCE
jgi:hypothetical protein